MTIETEDVVARLADARDTLAGHLFGHEANAVSAAIDLIQSLSERIDVRDQVIVALADGADKCGEAPYFIVQPFLSIYKKHGDTIAEVRASLTKAD